jgi:hypothetical protein
LSKSKYKVTKGLAQVITTGEPVFVTSTDEQSAGVVRPVVTQNGVEYREETFPLEQLETRFEAAKRSVEFDGFLQDLREEAQNKRYSLSAGMKAALKANAPQVG